MSQSGKCPPLLHSSPLPVQHHRSPDNWPARCFESAEERLKDASSLSLALPSCVLQQSEELSRSAADEPQSCQFNLSPVDKSQICEQMKRTVCAADICVGRKRKTPGFDGGCRFNCQIFTYPYVNPNVKNVFCSAQQQNSAPFSSCAFPCVENEQDRDWAPSKAP